LAPVVSNSITSWDLTPILFQLGDKADS